MAVYIHVVLPVISQRCQITATGVTSDTYSQGFIQREKGGNPPKFFLNLNFPAGTPCAPAGKCYMSQVSLPKKKSCMKH